MQWQRKTGVLACCMPFLVTAQTQTNTRRNQVISSEHLVSSVRSLGGYHRHSQVCWLAMVTERSFSLKCLPKFATGTSSQRRWKQLVPHQARCTSAPKHWQKANSIQCPQASLKLLTAFLRPESSPTDHQPCQNSRAITPYVSLMTNHHLSVEQKFHLEAAFREIDGCEDIEKLRALTKQIITAQENEKAFAREAMQQIRKEMEASAQQRFGFNWGQK